MKTLTPDDLKPGMPVRITHKIKPQDALVDGCMIYEGTVDSVMPGWGSDPHSGPLLVLNETDFQGGPIRLILTPSNTIAEVTIEPIDYPRDTFVLGRAIIHGTKEDPNGDRVETGERVWRWTGWSWQAVDGDDYLRLDAPEIASGQIIFAPSKVLHIPAKEAADVDA